MALIEKLKNIANAIRSKTNKSEELTLEQMASEIEGIDTLQGLDFSSIYDQEQANELNQYYKDRIAYAEQIKAENPNPSNSWYGKFRYNNSLVYMPNLPMDNITQLSYAFSNCNYLQEINCDFSFLPKNLNVAYMFNYCMQLKKIGKIDLTNCSIANGIVQYCYTLREVELINALNIKTWTSSFSNCINLIIANVQSWKNGDISLSSSSSLSPESIHYIIQNAMNVEDGATARTLTLHATAKTNWQNSGYYEQDLAVLEQKGITIA